MLPESEAHHALSVLRLKKGAHLVVLDGAGHEFMCEMEDGDRRSARLKIIHKHNIPPLPYQLTLVQAIPKGRTMEMIVQKATELGVESIVPILCERSVPQFDPEDADGKVRKWTATAVEAIKQCGRAWLPRIEPPTTLSEYLSRNEKRDLTLIASLQNGARHHRHYLEAFATEHQRSPKSVAVWIGPEGDFTPGEIHAVTSCGALPITLGPLVLRSDTAAIYSLAVIGYELQAT